MAEIEVSPMADEAYARIQADYEACKNKKKWKMAIISDRGQRVNVTFKDGFFVVNHNGVVVTMMPMKLFAMLQKHGRVGDFVLNRNNEEEVTEEDVSGIGFQRRMARFQTGNHNPRNHPVRVPTQPGQPTRG
jgi:hypothetical protein